MALPNVLCRPVNRKSRPQRKLGVEALEDRYLLSSVLLGDVQQISGQSPFDGVTSDLPQNIGEPTLHGEVIPLVAVDPADPSHIVIAWSQDEWTSGAARGLVTGVTFDGGKNWRTVVVPGLTQVNGGELFRATDPRIAIGPDGAVYASVVGGNRHPSFVKEDAILFSKSPDGGLTWNDPIVISENRMPGKFGHHPYITPHPTDADIVYLVRNQEDTAHGETRLVRSTDGGATFEPDVLVNQRPAWDLEGVDELFIHPDGTLIDVFSETVFDPQVLSVIHSNDAGATWSAPIRGPEYDTPLVIDAETGQGIWTLARHGKSGEFAMDRSTGTLYAVWEDGAYSGGQHTSVSFAMSTDKGQTWSNPIQINQTPEAGPLGNRQAYLPSMAVADDGTVGVAYYDFRNNTPDAGMLADYWFVYAEPTDDLTDPNSWTEVRLTESSFDIEPSPAREGNLMPGIFQATAAAGNDFIPVWVQPHADGNGAIDPASVFTRRVRLIPPGAPAGTDVIVFATFLNQLSIDDSQAVVAEATAPPNLEAATGDAWIAVAPAANGHAMDPTGITDDGEDQSEHHDLVDSLFAELSW